MILLKLHVWGKSGSQFIGQIAGFFKLSYLKSYLRYNVHFLHVVIYPRKLYLNHVIFAGFGQHARA